MAGAAQDSILTLVTFDPAGGRTQEVLLRFIEHEGNVYVLAPMHPSPRWVFRATGGSPLRWGIGPELYAGQARVIEDRSLIDSVVLPSFRRKYGPERVGRWFGAGFLCLGLIPNGVAGLDYHAQVEALFEAISPDYDAMVEGNPFDRYLREVSLHTLRTIFRSGDRVLEIGCGTGLETIPLAEKGVEIVAMDISGRMLERLRQKAAISGVGKRVLPRRLRADQLQEILREFGPGYFDGAFSNFGAMNCEPGWRKLPPILGRLLRPKGTLLLGVWNRICLVELLLFGLALKPRRALARLRSPVPVGLSRFAIPVFPLAPQELVRQFSPYFRPERLMGLPVFVPPYDLGRRLPAPDLLMPLLTSVDRILRDHYPFNQLGDHFLLTMRRG